jgi:predicted metal-dependent phosphoesterase TrpH
VADALIARGHVANRDEVFDRWLDEGKPGYVEHPRIPLQKGVALIRQAGGVSVLAHAWGRGSRAVLTSDVITALAADGLDGLEVDHHDHDASDRATLRALAESLGLIVTGSSDYHGTGKVDHDLGSNTTSEASYHAIVALIHDRGGQA